MSSADDRQLTTTSYAILCLLAVRPWSTYELAKQMRRALNHIWPRAESNVYAEPKRLVDAGLAHAEAQRVGKRPRTVYTITPQGREAVEQWLRTESAPSRIESEALVKVLFGNYGTKETLLTNLRAFAAEAVAVKELESAVASEYDRGMNEFPERLHVNSLHVPLDLGARRPESPLGAMGDRPGRTMARHQRTKRRRGGARRLSLRPGTHRRIGNNLSAPSSEQDVMAPTIELREVTKDSLARGARSRGRARAAAVRRDERALDRRSPLRAARVVSARSTRTMRPSGSSWPTATRRRPSGSGAS